MQAIIIQIPSMLYRIVVVDPEDSRMLCGTKVHQSKCLRNTLTLSLSFYFVLCIRSNDSNSYNILPKCYYIFQNRIVANLSSHPMANCVSDISAFSNITTTKIFCFFFSFDRKNFSFIFFLSPGRLKTILSHY